VGVRGVFSEWVEVVSGIPQGLVLGPLLSFLFSLRVTDDCNNVPQSVVTTLF
jgi:hypothetical protein